MSQWPTQSECYSFYGDPRGRDGRASPKWEAANLTKIVPPFKLYYDKRPVRTVLIHKKCADSLLRVLQSLWKTAGREQSVIDEWGVSVYGGCYNFRMMRGRGVLSMHAFACAIDLDPNRNGLNDSTPRFADYPWVIDAFEAEGWVWGGNWSRPDGMHFQAARV